MTGSRITYAALLRTGASEDCLALFAMHFGYSCPLTYANMVEYVHLMMLGGKPLRIQLVGEKWFWEPIVTNDTGTTTSNHFYGLAS